MGVCAILGHTWTPFLGFKGGKGVAASAGVFLGLLPVPFLFALGFFIVSFALTKIISVGSLTAACVFPLGVYLFEGGAYGIPGNDEAFRYQGDFKLLA